MLSFTIFSHLLLLNFSPEFLAFGLIIRIPAVSRIRAAMTEDRRSGAFGVKLASVYSGQEEGKRSVADEEEVVRSMTVKQIKAELSEMGISFQDCFDKESLFQRLRDARLGGYNSKQMRPRDEEVIPPSESKEDTTGAGSTMSRLSDIKEEYRKLRVSELRSMLGEQGIRWSNMIEKEDLVTALALRKIETETFSITQSLIPGKVNEVNGDELSLELEKSSAPIPPLLLDVYATWCGPCAFVAPQLEAASKELQSRLRVAKIDSDKYPLWSSKLKIGAFPTLILFDSYGKEIQRVEGALTKDQILDFVRKHINK